MNDTLNLTDQEKKLLTQVVDNTSLYLVLKYKHLLISKGAIPENHATIDGGDETSLNHLLWMTEHLIGKIRNDGNGFNTGKYSRWIGYIQGCLASKKLTKIEDEVYSAHQRIVDVTLEKKSTEK